MCACMHVHTFLILQVLEKYSTCFAVLDVMAGKSFCLFDQVRSSLTDILKKGYEVQEINYIISENLMHYSFSGGDMIVIMAITTYDREEFLIIILKSM